MPKNKLFFSLLIILIILTTIIYGIYFVIKSVWINPSLNNSSSNCSIYGMQPKENYLLTYFVKKGDTLLSIAKNQLGESSRVNEIIEMNKDLYPQLSFEKPFIEIGWRLYLPPRNWGITNGKIYAISGNVTMNNIYWGVKTPEYTQVGNFILKDLEKFNNDKVITKGICVTVIYQGSLYENTKIFSVVPQ